MQDFVHQQYEGLEGRERGLRKWAQLRFQDLGWRASGLQLGL